MQLICIKIIKKMKSILNSKVSSKLILKIAAAYIITLFAHTFLLAASAKTIKTWNLGEIQTMFLESSIITLFIVLGIWILRKRLDYGNPNSIGLSNFYKASLKFILGYGILLFPLIISLLITQLAGWAELKINWQDAQVDMILLGMLSVLITDALPEELVFRGYIFSNLLTNFVKWKSAIITTVLFVLFPIILFPLKSFLGSEITTGIVNNISIGYLAYMILFGAFAIYLRILTKSIWTGVGFHLMFVYMNQLIGIKPTNLIQFSNFENELLVQLTFGILLITTFISLFIYPKFKGIKLGWKTNID